MGRMRANKLISNRHLRKYRNVLPVIKITWNVKTFLVFLGHMGDVSVPFLALILPVWGYYLLCKFHHHGYTIAINWLISLTVDI